MKTTKKEKDAPARKSVMVTPDLDGVLTRLCEHMATEKGIPRVSEGWAVRCAVLAEAERRGIKHNGR